MFNEIVIPGKTKWLSTNIQYELSKDYVKQLGVHVVGIMTGEVLTVIFCFLTEEFPEEE